MKTFKFSFIGRISGAIGIFYKIRDTYKANSLGEALYMLYTDYEHIRQLYCNNEYVSDTKLIKCDVPKRQRNEKGEYIK